MARPRKYKIDYFPHFVASGKTMQILQHKYGNDGYAVWFKLLEVLGNSDGQYYDCTDPLNWEYLLSTFAVDNFLAIEIMDTLARIDAIDPELWAEKIIWVEKFVENLKQVYTKREVETPTKPSFRSGNHTSSGVSAPETPQSKVKESKGKDSKENNNEIEDFFERVWDQYPNKSGKAAVTKKTKAELLKVGEEILNRAIANYKKDLAINTWKNPMNGSTFFNGRYKDYSAVDYKPPVPVETKNQTKKSEFNNYDQRTYDYGDLERKLLGGGE